MSLRLAFFLVLAMQVVPMLPDTSASAADLPAIDHAVELVKTATVLAVPAMLGVAALARRARASLASRVRSTR